MKITKERILEIQKNASEFSRTIARAKEQEELATLALKGLAADGLEKTLAVMNEMSGMPLQIRMAASNALTTYHASIAGKDGT